MFWSIWLRGLFSTFGAIIPTGIDATARLCQLADQLHWLDVSELDPTALSILVLSCPGGQALSHQATQALQTHQSPLTPRGELLGRLTRTAQADEEWLLQARTLPSQVAVGPDALQRAHLVRLIRFLGYLRLTDFAEQARTAEALLLSVQTHLSERSIPAQPFTCLLYRSVLASLHPPLPQRLPTPAPAWLTARDERRFLARCLHLLSEQDRTLLFLSLVARLTVEQIRCILSAGHSWTPEQVLDRLARAYERVL